MSFTASKEVQFDAGHRVPYHDSACRMLHGHRYRVRATIEADNTVAPDPKNPRSGMVLDFGEIKKALVEQVHDKYDHKLILWEGDKLLESNFPACLEVGGAGGSIVVVPCIPTAEELARLFFKDVSEQLWNLLPVQKGAVRLVSIDVWETPNSLATYSGSK